MTLHEYSALVLKDVTVGSTVYLEKFKFSANGEVTTLIRGECTVAEKFDNGYTLDFELRPSGRMVHLYVYFDGMYYNYQDIVLPLRINNENQN